MLRFGLFGCGRIGRVPPTRSPRAVHQGDRRNRLRGRGADQDRRATAAVHSALGGHVGGQDSRVLVREPGDGLPQRLRVPAGDQHGRTLLQIGPGDRPPDARPTAGDQHRRTGTAPRRSSGPPSSDGARFRFGWGHFRMFGAWGQPSSSVTLSSIRRWMSSAVSSQPNTQTVAMPSNSTSCRVPKNWSQSMSPFPISLC